MSAGVKVPSYYNYFGLLLKSIQQYNLSEVTNSNCNRHIMGTDSVIFVLEGEFYG